MAKLLKLRRGTTSQHSSFTGAEGEVTVDTDKETLVVHNGSTAGGFPVMSAAGGTFTGAVTFNNDLDLQDDDKLLIGTGDDLQIYHNGTENVIDSHAGALDIISDNNTKAIRVHTDATVDIGNGADSVKLRFGAGSDMSIEHNGSVNLFNSAHNFDFKNGGEFVARLCPNGNNELYFDNSKKFETSSAGGTLTGALTVTNEINLFNGTTNASRYIDAGLGDSNSLVLRGCSGGDTGHETLAQFTRGGAAELYHDNTKKFETTSTGCNGPGGWQSPDGQAYRAGNSNDLLIYHDSANNSFYEHTNASGNIYFRNDGSTTYFQMGTSDESSLILNKDGSVELYYDNSKKFNTTSNGVQVTGDLLCDNATNAGKDIQWDESANKFYYFDDVKAVFGDDSDLEIYHDGTSGNSIIDNNTGQLRLQGDLVRLMNSAGSEVYLEGNVNGNVELYYDNSKKFETTNDGVELHGDIQLDDNTLFGGDAAKIRLGASQDLEIYHDGSNSILKDSSSGHFKIVGDSIAFRNQADNEDLAYFVADGAAKLYHNGIEMFETMAGGVRSGNGILFGTDTAAANRLSDYEEGTWTPALGGSGNSFTYHANTGGVYTKVGRMVYASGYIQLSARSGTSQLVLTGLPFAAGDHSTGSSAIEGGVHTHRVDNCAAGTSGPMGTIASSQSEASLWHAISSGNGSALNADEIDTTFVWGFSVMYPA